jgi:hypothetical protein
MLQQINWRQSEEEVCRTGSHIFSQGMFAGSNFADDNDVERSMPLCARDLSYLPVRRVTVAIS